VTRGARILAFPGLGLLGLLCAWPVASSAQDARPIEVEVRVIYAAKEKGVIEPDCVGIQKQLLPMRFGSMQVVQSQRFQLVPGGDPAQFELPTGRPVRLVPVSVIGPYVHIHFQMSGVLDTRLQMVSGRPMIVGGEKHGRGHLILEVTPMFDALDGPRAPSTASPKGPTVHRVRGTTAVAR
jgi:hypothetical protein